MDKLIYVIVWTGRDCDSGVWDTYPMLDEGFFYDKHKAQDWADYLNASEMPDYDADAEDMPSYGIQSVCLNDKELKLMEV